MSSIPGLYLIQFFQNDLKALKEKLDRIEQEGEAIIDLVNFDAIPLDLIPKNLVKEQDVEFNLFTEIGEKIFVSLVSKITMHSIAVSANALQLEESVVTQIPVNNPEAVAQPLPPQVVPTPALAEKLEEKTEKPPLHKRIASSISEAFSGEEEFKLFVEEEKRSLIQEYYGAKDAIKFQYDARRKREISNLREKVSETIPELVKRTHEFVMSRIAQVNKYVASSGSVGY